MARGEKNNVDYFPHPTTHGKKMFYLRQRFKNDGYTVWFMLLEELGKAEYHYLNLSDNIQLMYLSSSMSVPEETLLEIIDALVKFGDFDEYLWTSHKVLFNEKFVAGIADAYKKRSNSCISKSSLIERLGIPNEPISSRKSSKRIPKVAGGTQSKVKDIKVEETKLDFDARKLKFSATLSPFLETYGADLLNDFYRYWTEPNKSQTMFKQEMEKTWDLSRRLETWAKNDKKNFAKNNAQKNRGSEVIIDTFGSLIKQ